MTTSYPFGKKWPYGGQCGANLYEVARSAQPDFSLDCIIVETIDTFWFDPEIPSDGSVFYYLNRPLLPNAGSWGQDSELLERMVPCAVP